MGYHYLPNDIVSVLSQKAEGFKDPNCPSGLSDGPLTKANLAIGRSIRNLYVNSDVAHIVIVTASFAESANDPTRVTSSVK